MPKEISRYGSPAKRCQEAVQIHNATLNHNISDDNIYKVVNVCSNCMQSVIHEFAVGTVLADMDNIKCDHCGVNVKPKFVRFVWEIYIPDNPLQARDE